MKSSTETSQKAVIGGIAANTAMATLDILLLAEVHILYSSAAAVCSGLWVLLVGLLWMRSNKKTLLAEPQAEEAGRSRPIRRFLAGSGVFLVGVGETTLSGVLFAILVDYCSAHHHFASALPYISHHFVYFLVCIATVFSAINALWRQWLLLAGNIFGPLLVLGYLTLLAWAIMAGPGAV